MASWLSPWVQSGHLSPRRNSGDSWRGVCTPEACQVWVCRAVRSITPTRITITSVSTESTPTRITIYRCLHYTSYSESVHVSMCTTILVSRSSWLQFGILLLEQIDTADTPAVIHRFTMSKGLPRLFPEKPSFFPMWNKGRRVL